MMNLPDVKKKAIAMVRGEIRWTEERYQNACRIVARVINEDTVIDPLLRDQKKWDLAKILWDDVYGSYKDQLLAIIKAINETPDL